jgi:hypothetical protein
VVSVLSGTTANKKSDSLLFPVIPCYSLLFPVIPCYSLLLMINISGKRSDYRARLALQRLISNIFSVIFAVSRAIKFDAR